MEVKQSRPTGAKLKPILEIKTCLKTYDYKCTFFYNLYVKLTFCFSNSAYFIFPEIYIIIKIPKRHTHSTCIPSGKNDGKVCSESLMPSSLIYC